MTHNLIPVFLCKYEFHKIIVHVMEYKLLMFQLVGIFMPWFFFTSSISVY